MRTYITVACAAVVVGLAASAWAGQGCCAMRSMSADDAQAVAPAKAQTVCPVMKAPVNKEMFADYQGKRVYFCCGSCKATFEADPAKYVKQLEAEGVQLDKAPSPE